MGHLRPELEGQGCRHERHGGKLTHINYAFGNVGADGKCFEVNQPGAGDAFADYQKRFYAADERSMASPTRSTSR